MESHIRYSSWLRLISASVLLGALLPLASAVPQTPTPVPSLKQAADVATPPPHATPARISAYTLSPELYRKAHRLYRARFAIRVISTFYGIFVFWLILQAKWAAKFRDWAERATSSRLRRKMRLTATISEQGQLQRLRDLRVRTAAGGENTMIHDSWRKLVTRGKKMAA
jgi:hypothetical protein